MKPEILAAPAPFRRPAPQLAPGRGCRVSVAALLYQARGRVGMESAAAPRWNKLTVAGCFSVAVPGDAESEIIADGATLSITLPTAPRTDILVGRYDLPNDASGNTVAAALESEVRRFVDSAVSAALGRRLGTVSYDTRQRDATWICQAVVFVEDDRWWLVRAYAPPGGREYFLLHWNGPEEYLRTVVLKVFESFQPLNSRTG